MTEKKTYNFEILEKATKAELIAWIADVLRNLRASAPSYEAMPEMIEAFCGDWTGAKNDKAIITTDYFAEFWRLYPRKVNKKGALQSFNNAIIRGCGAEDILNAVAIFARLRNEKTARDPREEQFTPHATTWLNQDRFNAVDSYKKELMGLIGNSAMAIIAVEGI